MVENLIVHARDDGEKGLIDLSPMLVRGTWRALRNRTFFETVRITPYRVIGWDETDAFDICADWAYREVTSVDTEDSHPPQRGQISRISFDNRSPRSRIAA